MADKLMEDIKESIKALVESQKETGRMLQESKKETDRMLQESKKETDRLLQESKKETDRRIKETERMLQESKKETDRMLRESKKETERRERETDRRIKELDELFTGQWGKLMESLVEGDLIRLLQEKGVKVDTTLQNLKKKKDGEEWELDISGHRRERSGGGGGEDDHESEGCGPFCAKDIGKFGGQDMPGIQGEDNLWGDGVPEGRRACGQICGKTGIVCHQGDRLICQHCQQSPIRSKIV